MGSCLSCLGLGRKDSTSEENETSRLLSDNPYRSYGSRLSGPATSRPIQQPDPESVRREREVLDGICHAMSEYVHLSFQNPIYASLTRARYDVLQCMGRKQIQEADLHVHCLGIMTSDEHFMRLELRKLTIEFGRSNVIDVFTAQTAAAPRSDLPLSTSDGDLSAEDVRLRTIKKGRGGPIFSSLKGTSKGIQDAIG